MIYLTCTGHNASCLDHIWHNFDIDRLSYVLKPNISDHFAIATIFVDRVNSGTTVIKCMFCYYMAQFAVKQAVMVQCQGGGV